MCKELKRKCLLQVATEWLFSVPEHVLEKHLGSDPSTPTADADTSDEVKRSYAPRRSTLNVSLGCLHTAACSSLVAVPCQEMLCTCSPAATASASAPQTLQHLWVSRKLQALPIQVMMMQNAVSA